MALALPSRVRGIIQRVLGEQYVESGLRVYTAGAYAPSYTLDTGRVDYAKTRALYRNIDPQYKLGAGFAKPVVNHMAGFMGIPHFDHENPDVALMINEQMTRWRSTLNRINRNCLRDGDVFARVDRLPDRIGRENELGFQIRLITPDWVTPRHNPVNGQWDSVTIRYPVLIYDQGKPTSRQYTVVETLTPTTRTVEVDGSVPEDVRASLVTTEVNPWGVIPIVHFRNEAEDHQVFGSSDLEPLEPFFKAYHDTAIAAIRGSRLFSNPKVKFKLKDVDRFLRQNFTAEEIRSGRVNFQGKDILLMANEEDAEFITANSGADSYRILLELIFYCIVENSGIPEFVFGTAVQSSKASVDSQVDPFVKTVERKRFMFSESYGELAALTLWMMSRSRNIDLVTYRCDVAWPEVTPKDEQALATTINTLVTAFSIAVDSNFMSGESATDFLAQYVDTMLPWNDPDGTDDERRRVMAWRAYVSEIQRDLAAQEQPEEEEEGPPPPGGAPEEEEE